MASEHLRNEEDVEAILRIAVRGTDTTSDQLRERMKAAAEELGISEEELAAAEAKYRSEIEGEKLALIEKEDDAFLWRQFRRTQLHDLMAHWGWYLAVNAGLFGFDLFADGRLSWFFWPLIGWGIAVLIHTFSAMSGYSQENQDEFQKWKNKRERAAKRAQKKAIKATDGLDELVMDLLIEGKKIEAIKLVRDESGVGLSEAKAYVDKVEAGM